MAYLQDKLLVEGYAREVMRSDPSVDSSDAYSMAMSQYMDHEDTFKQQLDDVAAVPPNMFDFEPVSCRGKGKSKANNGRHSMESAAEAGELVSQSLSHSVTQSLSRSVSQSVAVRAYVGPAPWSLSLTLLPPFPPLLTLFLGVTQDLAEAMDVLYHDYEAEIKVDAEIDEDDGMTIEECDATAATHMISDGHDHIAESLPIEAHDRYSGSCLVYGVWCIVYGGARCVMCDVWCGMRVCSAWCQRERVWCRRACVRACV